MSAKPTTAQIRRAAHRLYDSGIHGSALICIDNNAKTNRDEDVDNPGTWIEVSIFVPDDIALEQKP